MPKGPLETVAEVRRVLDAIRESDDLKEGVAAFIVFPDRTLIEMAQSRPATRDALHAAPG